MQVIIRGKLGCSFPALLDNSLANYKETINGNQNLDGIKDSNRFVFKILTTNAYSKTYLRTCQLMPHTLRGTTGRKHIATYTAMFDIEENRISDLENLVGHDEQIHEDIHQVTMPVRDVMEVSQLLKAAIGEDKENVTRSDSFDNDHLLNFIFQYIQQQQGRVSNSSNSILSIEEENISGTSRNLSIALENDSL